MPIILLVSCEVQLSYAIGVSKPTSINIDCFGTNKIPEEKISNLVYENFDLRPKAIIENLDIKKAQNGIWSILKKSSSGNFRPPMTTGLTTTIWAFLTGT